MRQRWQWEVIFEETTKLVNKCLPHKASCGVVWEGEVNSLIKELLEFLLASHMRLWSTTNNGNRSFIVDPLWSPFGQGFCDTFGIVHVILLSLLLASLLLLLCGPYFLCFVNVDNRRHVLFGHNKHHGNHLFSGLTTIVEFHVNVHRWKVENHRLSFRGYCSNNLGLACACWSVEKERANVLRESFTHNFWT